MKSNVFMVQINFGDGAGRRGFTLPFEAAYDSVESLAGALIRHGVVVGRKLIYRSVDGVAYVVGREEMAIGTSGLVSISLATRSFVDGGA